jgi:hypothetical protein
MISLLLLLDGVGCKELESGCCLAPLRSLWDLQGISLRVVAQRAWRSCLTDSLFGHAAELGFYFLFALFPTLFSASSILGLAARSANRNYESLLHYLALVIPTAALGTVLETFRPLRSIYEMCLPVQSLQVGIASGIRQAAAKLMTGCCGVFED